MESTRARVAFSGHQALGVDDALLELAVRAADAFWITATLWVACMLYPQAWSSSEGTAAALAVALFYLIGHARGLHRPLNQTSYAAEFKRVWVCWLIIAPLLLGLAFATKTTSIYSRQIMTTWFVMAPTLVAASRVGLRLLMQGVHASGYNMRKVAIAGASELGAELARGIEAAPWMGLRFVGYYDDRRAPRVAGAIVHGASLKGDLQQLVVAARSGAIDLVYIALPLGADRRINTIIRGLQDTTASVYIACDFGGVDVQRSQWSQVGSVPSLNVVRSPLHGIDGLTKRLEDLVISVSLLVLGATPFALLALLIKLGSPGPVLVRQRRRGLHGEPMELLKFRTTAAADGGGPQLTPIGAFLLRTGLDDVPQLFQVLAGRMSMIGPRPHSAVHSDSYAAQILGQTLRQRVKPGITGWAQLHGGRVDADTPDAVRSGIELDVAYIRHWSLGLDLKILWLAFCALVRRH